MGIASRQALPKVAAREAQHIGHEYAGRRHHARGIALHRGGRQGLQLVAEEAAGAALREAQRIDKEHS